LSSFQASSDAEVPDWLAPLATSLLDGRRLEQVVALRPGVGGRKAGVLVLIGEGADGPEILFVERSSTMRTHAGQIALPGGASDPGDPTLADTALREAVEETGVDPSGIVVLGSLPPAHVAVSGFDVTAVVAWWRTPSPVSAVDPREAASVHIIPVAELVDPDRRVQVRHPSGYTGPAFEVRGLLIWGLTAHLVDGVLELAGWQRPWDQSRMAAIPERYLVDRRPASALDPDHPDHPHRDTGGHDAH
jgi:8-oxo-dGTP pyrophosphatase MutT (NUDIX family)